MTCNYPYKFIGTITKVDLTQIDFKIVNGQKTKISTIVDETTRYDIR